MKRYKPMDQSRLTMLEDFIKKNNSANDEEMNLNDLLDSFLIFTIKTNSKDQNDGLIKKMEERISLFKQSKV